MSPTQPGSGAAGEFSGKVALVTGGSSGIGRATARLLYARGATVFVGGSNREKLEHSLRELAGPPGSVAGQAGLHPALGDVRRVEDCARLVRETVDRAGRLDLVVNSAGVWVEGPAAEVSEESWDHVLDVNLKGTFFVCRYAVPELVRTRGCIVNVSSDSGVWGNDGAAVYCASKGGVTILTKALAVELAPRGVRVNAVCPGDVDTPMLREAVRRYGGRDPERYLAELVSHYRLGPGPRLTSAEEVAETIAFLASARASAITGACLAVDQGLTAGL
ncbi:MAG: SDR family oxidoreductase [Spirochaetales bacterium]|nr:SDR family oxidoreductase [Spirochaetales bacterium]